MIGNRLRAIVLALPVISLSACSGGGSGASGALPQAAQTSQTQVPFAVTLQIPSVTVQSFARNKEYISAGTSSAQLVVRNADGTASTTTANCTTVCTLATQIAPGSVQLTISLYAGRDAGGAVLSSGSVSTSIVRGQQNSLSLTLGGVVASLALTLGTSSFTLGTPATTTLDVAPLDASGNRIIGSSPFTSPITLSIANNASEFSLVSTSITSPDTDAVTLAFNGGSTLTQPTITATVAGSNITAHTTLGTRSAIVLPSVAAVSASAFTNSIGVNTHFNYPEYNNSFATVQSLLVASGIRHIRDGFVDNPASAAVYFGYLQQLQSNGIRATMSTSLNLPASTILANVQAVPNFTEAIEAPNEYDLSGDPNWLTNLAAYQRQLYAGVKSTPGISSIPVIGPALTSAEAYARLGDLSSYMDQGNMHDYFAGYNPGTAGYGGGGFGSVYGTIRYNQGEAAQVSGSKPVVATETGYCTVANTRNAVAPALEAKYLPRMFLEQWLAGVPRTLEYEFVDEGTGSCNGSYGLLTTALTPKPGYYAVQHFLAALNDSGSGGNATALPMSITSSATSVHSLLLQKSNGSYVLALWNEVSSWDVNNGTGAALSSTPIPVSIQLAATPSVSQVTILADDGSAQPVTTTWTGGLSTLSIDDHVTLVSFTP